nr:transposase, mutator type [Tanacetum cinerariifolium]
MHIVDEFSVHEIDLIVEELDVDIEDFHYNIDETVEFMGSKNRDETFNEEEIEEDVEVLNNDYFESDSDKENELDRDAMKELIKEHSIETKRKLRMEKNDKERVRVTCKGVILSLPTSEPNGPAYEWLLKIPPQYWAISHFSGRCKSDVLVNNMCEVSMEKCLVVETRQSILHWRIVNVNKMIARCDGPLTPTATKLLKRNSYEATKYTVEWGGGTRSDYAAAADKGKGVAVDDGSNKKKCQPMKKIINIDTVMSDSEDSMVTYTEVSSSFEDLSDIRSSRVDGLLMMPEDPYAYVEAALQDPPSPNYVPGPKEPELAPPTPEFVLEPVYPEFMPPTDDVLPAEEHPLPATVLPATDSPGYILESNPEEDNKDPKEDLANYPTDREDDDEEEESSGDDVDDEEKDDDVEEEVKEHPAPADSVPPSIHCDPPSPNYVPGPKEPELVPPTPEFVLEPVYPEFMPPTDDVLPAKEHPLSVTVLPATDSPGYILKSNPEEDNKDPKEDLANYPTDREDDDEEEESSGDDVDDEEKDDDVEEEVGLGAQAYGYVGGRCRTPPLLPIPLPTSSPPLLLPFTSHRADVLEVTLSPHKRFCIALGLRFKVGDSLSAPTARHTRGFRADYRFVGTLDDEIRRDPEREIGYGITDTWDEIVEDMQGKPAATNDDDVEEEVKEHPAPADSVPPSIHRVTARISVQAQTPISLPSETKVARLLAIPTPPPSPLPSLSSPLPQMLSPLYQILSPPLPISPP